MPSRALFCLTPHFQCSRIDAMIQHPFAMRNSLRSPGKAARKLNYANQNAIWWLIVQDQLFSKWNSSVSSTLDLTFSASHSIQFKRRSAKKKLQINCMQIHRFWTTSAKAFGKYFAAMHIAQVVNSCSADEQQLKPALQLILPHPLIRSSSVCTQQSACTSMARGQQWLRIKIDPFAFVDCFARIINPSWYSRNARLSSVTHNLTAPSSAS